mmetsp:Transcript_44189/g.96094  ORF Transcript_44189/g.96094 Transcript_44189/m.96094 type:complete len:270 (-) Transcript_44189:2-811(-)
MDCTTTSPVEVSCSTSFSSELKVWISSRPKTSPFSSEVFMVLMVTWAGSSAKIFRRPGDSLLALRKKPMKLLPAKAKLLHSVTFPCCEPTTAVAVRYDLRAPGPAVPALSVLSSEPWRMISRLFSAPKFTKDQVVAPTISSISDPILVSRSAESSPAPLRTSMLPNSAKLKLEASASVSSSPESSSSPSSSAAKVSASLATSSSSCALLPTLTVVPWTKSTTSSSSRKRTLIPPCAVTIGASAGQPKGRLKRKSRKDAAQVDLANLPLA